jgi:leucyl aminopeptidase
LVGKAVTFDTGGISIKPSDKMDEMKFDKSGGCNILGIFKALNMLNIPINVVGIVPSVENMPSSSSYRPGDIIKMYNGKTVEVLNTDAEGRLILADALSYGIERYSPKCIIDFATLTGACIIALGSNVAGAIGNNDILIQKIVKMSEETGEKIWQLPLFEEFFDLIKSNIANIKNIGGRTGGAITAAAFLSHFVDDVPWVHIDIAGTAWTQDGTIEKSYNPKGATGFGIRTILKLLERDLL